MTTKRDIRIAIPVRSRFVRVTVTLLVCASVVIPVLAADEPISTAAEPSAAIRPFRINIPEAALVDLRQRIEATRWPDEETVTDQSQGVQLAKLQPLVKYWGTAYDWRKAEAKLNAIPEFVTTIDGASKASSTRPPNAFGSVNGPMTLSCSITVLDDFTLYWLTDSATSAARLYWENMGRGAISATAQKTADISVPVAITVCPDEIHQAPEAWARRAFRNLIDFHEVDRGGHFAAGEQPQLLSEELRDAFRPLRKQP